MNPRLRVWVGANVYQSSEPVASARAHWLTELATALEEAHRLTVQLGIWRADSHESLMFGMRILAARAEVEALRRSGVAEVRREIDPDWTRLALWRGNLPDRAKL